ncbi:MAG TPA: glycoside hydrolase family 32 protein [Chitinophagaceae bacterium]|nr:glycoside hydrolase family 32 protein [Chitinophagaceae bacterium]
MKLLITMMAMVVCLALHAQPVTNYTEQYRPGFHYTPAVNWCNDPNGLVYNNGVYHLFHQYNPFGNVWGHMSWAHASSKDLVHWKPLPLALAEEKDTMIFSGSCVVDKNNSSGFAKQAGQQPMVAIYTGHVENSNQSQHLAYSLDNGTTWTKYGANPVLDLHKKDFRDPKVFWHEGKQYWVMAVVLPLEHLVQFYSSFNLKEWTHLSNFGPAGDTAAVWECPDLSELPVMGKPGQKKWLLQTSQNAGMQYFVGSFDGIRFTQEPTATAVPRPDYGPEYYAAITFNQLPAAQLPTAMGWINNWNYANDIPTSPWKGAMSLPRTLQLRKDPAGWVLLQQPLTALRQLRLAPIAKQAWKKLEGSAAVKANSTQCEIEFEFTPGAGSTCGIRLAAGNGRAIEIGYDAAQEQLYIDRGKTANQSFNKQFVAMARYQTHLPLQHKSIRLHLFFDHSIVELFANDGEAVMTTQFFPGKDEQGIEVFSEQGASTITQLTVWPLKSIW